MGIKRILVVDDSATERHIIGEILSKRGFEVSFAEDGEKGVAANQAEQTGSGHHGCGDAGDEWFSGDQGDLQ